MTSSVLNKIEPPRLAKSGASNFFVKIIGSYDAGQKYVFCRRRMPQATLMNVTGTYARCSACAQRAPSKILFFSKSFDYSRAFIEKHSADVAVEAFKQ